MVFSWKRTVGIALLLTGLFAVPAHAQIYDENFESYTDGTTTPGDGSWTRTLSLSPEANPDVASVQTVSGDKVFQVQDADEDVIWETETIDISGSSGTSFQVVLDQNGGANGGTNMEDSDYVDVAYSVDGGSFTRIPNFNGQGDSQHTLTGNWPETAVTTDGISGNSLTIRVTFNNSANSEDFYLDDVKAFGDTRVLFEAARASVQEGDNGTTTVNVDIGVRNPSSSQDTQVDVAVSGGTATKGSDYDFTDETVTFAAGTRSSKTVPIDVFGDPNREGNETVGLQLSNVTGGKNGNAKVASPAQYTLTIERDDFDAQEGDMVITEVMYAPSVSDSDGEWVEVHNTSDVPINLENWDLVELGGSHTVNDPLTVSPGEYVVLCEDDNQSVNGTVPCDYDYSGLTFNNGGDTIDLVEPGGTRVDRVAYDGGTNWPDAADASLVFTETASDDNNVEGNWVAATAREPTTSLADPGSPGLRGSNQTLAVRRPMDAVAGWRFVSPPKTGLDVQYLADQGFVQGVSGRRPSGAPNVYVRYNPPNGAEASDSKQYWEAAGAVTDPLEQGRGTLWYLWKEDVPAFLTTTGTISNVSTDQTLSGLGDHKWHLLGNPFPNDFRIGDLNATDFGTTAQVWVPSQQTFRNVGPNQSTKAVGPQVGFYLERTAGLGGGSSASVTFPAGGQSVGAQRVVRKAGGRSGRVSLATTGVTAGGDTATVDRAATLVLDDRAGAGRDRYDATKLTPFSSAYAVMAFAPTAADDDTTQRSVASYPLPADGKQQVPIEFVTGGDPDVETYTVTWPSLSLPPGWTATLVDRETGEKRDLGDASAYTFAPSKGKTAATVNAMAGTSTSKTSARSSDPRLVPPVPVALSRAASEAARQKSTTPPTEERFALVLQNSSALPVELSAFSAETDGEDARLSWRTASETNNSGFYVEHRAGADGDAFRRLGFVDGAGTTSNAQSYTYRVEDLEPGPHTFRLRQVDTDGTVTRTEPTSIRVLPDEPLTLSPPAPNPVRSAATATVSVRDETAVTVALYDALGRRVRTLHDGPVPAANPLSLSIRADDLASGLYLLRATGGGRSVTRKVTVVR